MAYDIRKDPKFLARTKTIESKANIKKLKEPVEIMLGNLQVYILAIGINGSYLAVVPGMRPDGTHVNAYHFATWWTDKKSAAFNVTEIPKFMVSWLITSDETDYIDIPHRDFSHVNSAVEFMIKLRGIEYFSNGKKTVSILDQGIEREIPNPLDKRR